MTAFGSVNYGQYPGTYQPGFWTTSTSVSTYPIYAQPTPLPTSEPEDKSNVGWLRERVQEICSLAEFEVA